MQFRIVKEETLRFDGKVVVRYIPQYKGWLFWNRFERGCDAFTYNYAVLIIMWMPRHSLKTMLG